MLAVPAAPLQSLICSAPVARQPRTRRGSVMRLPPPRLPPKQKKEKKKWEEEEEEEGDRSLRHRLALGLGPNVQTIPMSFVVFSDEIVSHLQCSSSALCELCWSFEVGGVWDQHADLRCDAAHLLTVLLMKKKHTFGVTPSTRPTVRGQRSGLLAAGLGVGYQ